MSNDLSRQQLASMIDLSAVRAEHGSEELEELIETAIQYQVKCVFALPAQTPRLIQALEAQPDILVGGVVGFPAGGSTTASKVFECQELVAMGCDEIDMVMNIAWLKSGLLQQVQADIQAVVEAAGSVPVKVILECHHLTDEEIGIASQLAAEVGVAFVKTGTGWCASASSAKQVSIMTQAVDGKCQVKSAGGVRDLATLMALYQAGARRFGIGVKTAKGILTGIEVSAEDY